MKLCSRILVAVLVLFVISAPLVSVYGQVVKVKIEAMSPDRRSSGPPDYTAPSGAWFVSTGLPVVAKGMKVYLSADTTGSGSSTATTFTWTFAGRPGGSSAVFDSANKKFTSFTADTTGFYYVQVAVNGGGTSIDTLFASTYVGVKSGGGGCATGCHNDKVTAWKNTNHSTMFARAISGQLEVNPLTAKGVYATFCIKCHTTGWEPTAKNGNFGALASASGFDTMWYKTYTNVSGEYEIPYNDSTALKLMNASYSQVVPTATIGCESCHGPGADHSGDKTKIGKSLDAGVCLQCHAAAPHHHVGKDYMASDHALMAKGHASSTTCYPCHSGTAFAKWLDNKSNPGWDIAVDGMNPIACASCHDPHDASNPNQLRTVGFDSLMNGYRPPAGMGGKGQLCMNCHHSRYSVAKKVTTKAPLYGYSDHYGPHGNPQADMLFGQNSYEFGDSLLKGLSTHTGLKDGCVTCHMQDIDGAANHTWAMSDTAGDFVAVCQDCHGPISSFDDVKASYDYDHNGVVEGVQTEIEGMMSLLKAKLPKDTTGEPVTSINDSNSVKNHPELVQGIWTYYFVKNDGSMGVHNAKYAVAILQKALGFYPTDVKQSGRGIPTEYALEQNYPNPFNPSTTLRFSLKAESHVKLQIYDILGNLIRTLVDKDVAAGTFQLEWSADNDQGLKVPSGVYLARIQAGSFTSVRKMLLAK